MKLRKCFWSRKTQILKLEAQMWVNGPSKDSPCGTAHSGCLRSPPSEARCRPGAPCWRTAGPCKSCRGDSLSGRLQRASLRLGVREETRLNRMSWLLNANFPEDRKLPRHRAHWASRLDGRQPRDTCCDRGGGRERVSGFCHMKPEKIKSYYY